MSSRHNLRARVYIGRLPSRAQERDITKFFKSYGRIIDIQLKNGYGFVEFDDARDADDAVHDMNGKDMCGERVTIEHAKGPPRSVVERERRGYGGRNDDRRRPERKRRSRSRSRSRDRNSRKRRSASRSRSRSPRDRRDSRRRDARRSRSASPRSKPTKFFRVDVENLPSGTTRKELETHMAAAGKILSCEIHDDGKGYVDFEEETGQVAALETLSGVDFKETKLTLAKGLIVTSGNNGNKSRSASRSRSRSRSARRSRSRSHSAEKPSNGANGKSATNGSANGAAKRHSSSRSRSHSRSASSHSGSRSRSHSPAANGKNGSNGNGAVVAAIVDAGHDMDQSSASGASDD